MEEGEPPAGLGLGLVREGSGREREWVQGEQPPESVVLKQKPYTKLWVERYAKIEPPGLSFYTSASDTVSRGSSIDDLRRCTVKTLGTHNALGAHNGWYLVTLERQGDEFLPDLQDDGASRFCFEHESDRDQFALALRNLAEGNAWNAVNTPPASPAAQAMPYTPAAVDALKLGSPSFEVERTQSNPGPIIEGWLEKWRRSTRFDLTRSGQGHWQRLYFVLDPKDAGLKYFKANPSQKNGATWKELLFEHMEDPHKMWDTGAQGQEARDLALEFRFDYRLSDKVYCLRTESTASRDEWFNALEGAVRRHHKRRAVRAITSGHLPDPTVDGSIDFVPTTPKADRFSIDDLQQWKAEYDRDALESGLMTLSIRHIGDDAVGNDEQDLEPGEAEHARERPLRTTSDEHPSANLARVQSATDTNSSSGKKRLKSFRKRKSKSAANLEPVSQQLCVNTRCLAPLRPRHHLGAHGKTPHKCDICWKSYCGDCVRKRNLSGGPGSKGKGGSRVVVCDVCYWQHAPAPPPRSFSGEGSTSASSASYSPLPSGSTGQLEWAAGMEPGLEPGAEPEPESESEPEPESQPVATRGRSQSGLQMEEFFIPFEEITLGRPIDSGAFGTVYRGSYLGPVAVKAIPQRRFSSVQQVGSDVSPDPTQQLAAAALLSAQMVEEIRAQTRFHHQNVVQFLGLACGRPPHAPGKEHWMVVTELCDMNLFGLLRSTRLMPWRLRLKIALDISQGMTYLHDKQQLAHLDLKSPNVLLKGKDAKLADFGSLKRLGDRRNSSVPNGTENNSSTSTSSISSISTLAGGTSSAASSTATVADADFAVGGVGGTAEAQAAALRLVKASKGAEDGGEVLKKMGVPQKAALIAAGSLHSSLSSSRSSTGHALGTPEWMAPELLDVRHPSPTPTDGSSTTPAGRVDWKAADRYSFAVILWELLTRKRPYLGFGGAAAVQAVGPTIVTLWAAEGQRPAFPGADDGLLPGSTPPAWKALCESCWTASPADRPVFSEITQALRDMLPELASWGDPDSKHELPTADDGTDF